MISTGAPGSAASFSETMKRLSRNLVPLRTDQEEASSQIELAREAAGQLLVEEWDDFSAVA